MSSGWHVHGDTLTAYATWSQSARFFDFTQTMLWAISSVDSGKTWSKPEAVVPGTYLEEPRATGTGTWLLLGQGADHQPIFFYTTDPGGLKGWKEATMDFKVPSRWPEPSCFIRTGGEHVVAGEKSGHPDTEGSGGFGGLHAVDRVLENHTLRGRCAQLFCGFQKNIRIRFFTETG